MSKPQHTSPGQIEKARGQSSPSLLDSRQPLGFLPTLWFWRDKENVRLVRWPLWVTIIAAFALAIAIDAGWLVSGLIPVAGILISLGLIERFVRRKALKRRSELERHALGSSDATDEPREAWERE